MTRIFESIIPIFVITLLGGIIKRRWMKDEEQWRGIERLSYFILFPAALIHYVGNANLGSSSLNKLLLSILGVVSTIAFALYFYQKKYNVSPQRITSVFQGSLRYNSYIFLSVASTFFDNEIMSVVAAIACYMIVVLNIISTLVFTIYIGNKSHHTYFFYILKSIVENPFIIASGIGVTLNLCEVDLVVSIDNALRALAGAAFPIGCIIIGANLRFKFAIHDLQDICIAVTTKLLLFPVLIFVIMKLLNVDNNTAAVGILYGSMPPATNAYILSRQLGGDHEMMATITTIATVLSIITTPLMMYCFTAY